MHINLLLTKEEQLNSLSDSAETVVIIDILLATSTIVECLAAGAKAIYPVENKEDALKKSQKLIDNQIKESDIFLAGEINAITINGFINPTPLELQKVIKDKYLILLTTNGTVAIQQAKKANNIYISSLLNGKSVASHLIANNDNTNIDLVCSGSNGFFSLEDFYGAGQLIHYIVEAKKNEDLTLSDSTLAAKLFYESNRYKSQEILTKANVGKLLSNLGLEDDLEFVSKENKYQLVPYYQDKKILLYKEGIQWLQIITLNTGHHEYQKL